MRLFCAVDLPQDPVLESLADQLKTVKGLKVTDPRGHHITLKFIGDHPASLTDITASLGRISSKAAPFSMGLEGYGAFPNWEHPSVLWMGFGGSDALGVIVNAIEIGLEQDIGLKREVRPFKAHMTAARVKQGARPDIGKARGCLADAVLQLKEKGYRMNIKDFKLYNSTLTPAGPRYEIIETFVLPRGEG